MRDRIDRRGLLRVSGLAGVGLLAGCSQDGEGNQSTAERISGGATTAASAGPLPADCPRGAIEPDETTGVATLWHQRFDERETTLEDTIEQFESDSDQAVEPKAIPQSLYPTLYANRDDEDAPHLFEWTHDRAESFVESDLVVDQSGAVDYPTCQLLEFAVDAARYRDAVVGVPFAGETVALLYNREMVDDPPETLEAMRAIMKAHHEPRDGQYGLAYPINPYYASAFAQAYGEAIYDGEADELGVTDEAVQRGLEVLFDELAPYMPEDPSTQTQVETFDRGDAPLLIGGPWNLWGFDSVDETIDVGVTALPSLPDGGEPRPYAGVRLHYFGPGMETDSEGAGAARDYAEWVATNEEVLLEHARESQLVPVHRGLLDSGRLPERVETFARQVRDGYPMPQNPKMDNVWGPFGDAVVDTYNGEGDLEANLAAAEAEIREAWAED